MNNTKYKEAKKIMEKDSSDKCGAKICFGWKWRVYPRLKKQMKEWTIEIKELEN